MPCMAAEEAGPACAEAQRPEALQEEDAIIVAGGQFMWWQKTGNVLNLYSINRYVLGFRAPAGPSPSFLAVGPPKL